MGRRSRAPFAGFTLIEMVVTMVVLGIVSAIVVTFMQKPIQGYFDTARRARLVNTADFALRRMTRDLATAVPNSVRASGGIIEMLAARSGGRYCSAADCDSLAGYGTALIDSDFTFKVLGPAVAVASGDSIVIGNLPGSGCDAYAAAPLNRRALTFSSTPVTSITFTGGAFSSACAELTSRFDVVSGPVAYACDSATNTVWRYSSYAIQAAIPASVAALDALAGPTKAALATDVLCSNTFFDVASIAEGLIELRIRLQDSSTESVNLYRQVKVDNTP